MNRNPPLQSLVVALLAFGLRDSAFAAMPRATRPEPHDFEVRAARVFHREYFFHRWNEDEEYSNEVRFGPLETFPHRVAVKITYLDRDQAEWSLTFKTSDQKTEARSVTCGNTGKVRTATFILPAAWFPGRGYRDSDLQIQANKGDAVIRLVRIIKLR